VTDPNAVDVGNVLGTLLGEEIDPTTAQARRRCLARIVHLDGAAIQDDVELRLDGRHHLGRRLEGRKPFNDKGFQRIGQLGHGSTLQGETVWVSLGNVFTTSSGVHYISSCTLATRSCPVRDVGFNVPKQSTAGEGG
jgi:hypothetical protein